MSRLRFALFAILAVVLASCRSGSDGTANKGTSPETYLASDGNLAHRFEVEQGQTIGGGATFSYIIVDTDGKWKTGKRAIGSHASKQQDRDKEAANGILTKNEIADLAKVLAKHDLANLPSDTQEMNDPTTIRIFFGKGQAALNYTVKISLCDRYLAIAEGVRNIVEKSESKK